MQMKLYPLFPIAVLMSCQTVKSSNNPQTAEMLLNDVKSLASDGYQGRKTGTKGAELARDYIKGRLRNLGVSAFTANPDYEQSFTALEQSGKEVTGTNVIAYIPGKTDQVIVISAHYDHLGIINDEVYNGADDNASGVAGLLKIAAHYKKAQPTNTLIFAFFDAGELDWQGSKAFVKQPPVPLEKVVLNVNLDMISRNEKGQLYASGTYKYPQLKPYLTHSNQDVKIILGHDNPSLGVDDWTNQSDQGAFNAKNIPYIYFGVEDHTDYHKASDEFENINQTFFINAANSILEIIDNFDKERNIQAIFRQKVQMKKQ
jgi:Zn-dependent M28 family amino/carboxypeptidase